MAAAPPNSEGDEAPPTLSSLPDALVQHALSFLDSDLAGLGRALCTSVGLSKTGRDDAVWRPFCVGRYGLEDLHDPTNELCDSWWHAARAWTQLCVEQGDPSLWKKLSSTPRLAEGCRVTLLGLSREELNGRSGRTLRKLADSGRWEVELEATDGPATLSVKPENLAPEDRAPVPLMAPLWLRSASAWRVLEDWAAATMPELRATFGPPVSASAFDAFLREVELPPHCHVAPLRALWAQHDGQHIDIDMKIAIDNEVLEGEAPALSRADMERQRFLGLVGGYSAYNHAVSVRLLPLRLAAVWTKFLRSRRHELFTDLTHAHVVVAATYNMQKFFLYDTLSGDLLVCPARTDAGSPLLRAVPAATRRGDDLLAWLAELGRRCATGVYIVELIAPDLACSTGLSLFPRAGPALSRAVTRGVEVVSSALFSPEQGSCIYSIRIRLLPEAEGGPSAAERGFETCQLHSRHWVLSDDAGRDEQVHGDGVVGCYPLLREGGYRDDRQSRSAMMNIGVPASAVREGDECEGTFVYQSMSGRGGMRSFGGELTFVPGTYAEPTGEEFNVVVARFPLSDGTETDQFFF